MDLPITFSKRTVVSQVVRQNLFVRVPGRRQVDLYDDQTGDAHQVTFDFTHIMQRVTSPTPSRNPATGPARGECTEQSGRWLASNQYIHWWRNNKAPAQCWSYPKASTWGQSENVTVDGLSVGYKLQLPPTYYLRAGTYRASLDYSIGPGGEFDFGDDVTSLSDANLRINIVVEVQHNFRVEFPLGFDHAVLEPPGGWAAWLDGGRVPTKLAADLPMRLWSTGPFKVYKLCEYDIGEVCGIRNRRGEEVPVQVFVSMPYGVRYMGWQTVIKHPLPSGQVGALELDSMLVTANGPGQLHFEVSQDDLRPMLKNGGELYSGKVTIVFDAQI